MHLPVWLGGQKWSSGRNDQHRNGLGGFCLTRAFADRMNGSWRLKEAPSGMHFLDRLTLEPESRGASRDVHVDRAWVAVRKRRLAALGLELEADDYQLLARNVLQRRRENGIRLRV